MPLPQFLMRTFSIDPCIPAGLCGFRCQRRYRGVNYIITVDNTAGVKKGVREMSVDGRMIEGNTIPIPSGVQECSVKVVMG